MAKNDKTNVMRVLEQHKIPYEGHNYLDSGAISGTEVAEALNENPEVVFKTLVTIGKTGNHYVFLVPVELNPRNYSLLPVIFTGDALRSE